MDSLSSYCFCLMYLMLLFLSRFRKNRPPQELSEAVVKDLQQALAKAEDQASESRSFLCSSKIAAQDGAWYALINSVGENGSWTSRKYGVMELWTKFLGPSKAP